MRNIYQKEENHSRDTEIKIKRSGTHTRAQIEERDRKIEEKR